MFRLLAALVLCFVLTACGTAPRVPEGSRFTAPGAQPAAPTATPEVLLVLPTAQPAQPAAIAVGVPFELPLGEELALGETGLSVIFSAVTEDSRCPENARCLWAGRAVVTVEVLAAGRPAEAFTLAIPGEITPDAPEQQVIGAYTLRLIDLAPYPATPGSRPALYVATLVLDGP